MLTVTFQPFHIGEYKGQEDIAAYPRQCSSGWLGYFSLERMDLLENIFQPYGQVSRDDLMNPLWAELVSHV